MAKSRMRTALIFFGIFLLWRITLPNDPTAPQQSLAEASHLKTLSTGEVCSDQKTYMANSDCAPLRSSQREVVFLEPLSIKVDKNSRLQPAILTFRATNTSKDPRSIVRFATVVCQFFRANHKFASPIDTSVARGGVSYLRPGETVEGSVILPMAPEAIRADCEIERVEYAY
jgi:hypothetical protein